MIFTSLQAFCSPFSTFCSLLLLFLFCFLFYSLFVMDFPPVPDGLGDDFGDFDGAGAASFSFEDFDLGDVTFAHTRARTSSAIAPAAGTSSGSSSHSYLS